jgi:uncharacterized membrane protein (UPF0127 family)
VTRRRAPLVLAVVVLVAAGCSSGRSAVAPATTSGPATSAPVAGATGARPPFESFDQVRATIRTVQGGSQRPCLLLAWTEAQRERGLMQVVAAALHGYAGMAFWFPSDVTTAFTMAHTLIPLDVVFVDSSGEVQHRVRMAPCPQGESCPTYPPPGAYRTAIEVPAGTGSSLGLVPGSTVRLGGRC